MNGFVEPKSLIVIDQRRLIADAMAALLVSGGRFTVSTCAFDEAHGPAVAAAAPDLVLIVVGESREPALEMVRKLKQSAPGLRIALIADSQDPELIRSVLNQDVVALILSAVTAEDFAVTLDHVMRGNTALPAGWRGTWEQSENDPVSNLSTRQREVLELLADGCSYEEIGERLIISPNTVKFHVHTTYVRLGVTNRMAAVNLLNAHSTASGRPRLRTYPNGWEEPTPNSVT